MVAGVLILSWRGYEDFSRIGRSRHRRERCSWFSTIANTSSCGGKLAETIIRTCPTPTCLRRAARSCGSRPTRLRVPPLDGRAPSEESDIVLTRAVQAYSSPGWGVDSDFSTAQRSLRGCCQLRRLGRHPARHLSLRRLVPQCRPELVRSAWMSDSALTGGRRTALPRHQTLRATLDWTILLTSDGTCLLWPTGMFAARLHARGSECRMSDQGYDRALLVRSPIGLPTRWYNGWIGYSGRWRLLETILAYAPEKTRRKRRSRKVCATPCLILARPRRPPPMLAVQPPFGGHGGAMGGESKQRARALDWSSPPSEMWRSASVLTAA